MEVVDQPRSPAHHKIDIRLEDETYVERRYCTKWVNQPNQNRLVTA